MQSLPTALYTLQKLELAVDKARDRISAIDEQLANNDELKLAQRTFDEVSKDLHQAQANIKDLELEISSLSQKIKDVNDLLYSGKIHNPKELTDRQNELESLRRRLGSLETRLIEGVSEVDTLSAAHSVSKKSLNDIQTSQRQENIDLVKEREKIDHEIKQYLRKRKTALKDIPEPLYKEYRALRKRKRGQAVATLKGNACSLCGVSQTTSSVQEIKDGQSLIHCSNCGRILVSI